MSEDTQINQMQDLGANEEHIHAALLGENQPWWKQIAAASVPELQMIECLGGVAASSQDARGCKVVLRLLEKTNTKDVIFGQLLGHMWELAQCCNGSSVLQECIKQLPGAVAQIIQQLMAWGPDSAKYLAEHRFGFKVFQRLLQHGSAPDLECLHSDAWRHAGELCKNRKANCVMRTAFEHSPNIVFPRRHRLVAEIEDNAARMCHSPHGAAVLEGVFLYGMAAEKQAVARSLRRSSTQWRTSHARKMIIAAVDKTLRIS